MVILFSFKGFEMFLKVPVIIIIGVDENNLLTKKLQEHDLSDDEMILNSFHETIFFYGE